MGQSFTGTPADVTAKRGAGFCLDQKVVGVAQRRRSTRCRAPAGHEGSCVIDPLFAVLLWWVVAIVMRLVPSRDNHWQRAYILIGLGIPLVIWVAVTHNILVGLVVLVSGASVVRWPIYYLFRWIKQKTRGS